MEKVLELYKYIDGVNDVQFPSENEQLLVTNFRYDAKRMGGAPTINFTAMHRLCLDSLWSDKVYAMFNGERYFVKQTPTSSYSASDTRYKHEVELVSERFVLDNVYFYDVVSSSNQDKPVSNSSKFSFFGNIEEYVSRLNNSLNKSNVGYSIVIDDDILSDEALMSIESQVAFEDQVITNALQEIYNVYKIPYYFVGKIIHVGYYQDNINTVFKYGCDNSLISISKTNANSKVINKITGVGSSDNIPYYYPNVDEKGITHVLCNGREGEAEIIDLAKYRKVKLADKFVFHETIQSLVPLIDEDDYSFGDFRDEGLSDDEKQRVSIDFYYTFALNQFENVEFSVTTTYEDSLDLIYEIFNPSGQYVGYYKGDKTMQLTGGNYQFVIRWSFLSKEPMIGSDDVIKNFVSQYLNVTANIVVDSSNAWTMNNIPVTLSDYGISVNSPSDGDVLTIERLAYIQPQPNLVPPIYRDTKGGERFYEAINGKYENEQGGYYQFDNEYTPTNPREHIENFDDIKPTIKNVVNDRGEYIDEFIDFAYDLDDNDETDESGKFIHPYFFGKLRKFDGEYGFNLFDHAIDEGEMVVSMTSGTCGSCEFVIGVDEQSQKNIVQVDANGNLVRDNNGNVRRTGTPQDRQNDTKNNEVWIALKKDIQTFGVVMPNVGNNYRPKAGDKFVLLHIDLPQQYVKAAENALKDKLIKYMHENNFEKFNFSISFSRIYFAENPSILASLSENSKIQVEYNKNVYELYVSSLSYSISSDSALPEVKVELEDVLSISQNQITQVVESTKREIISSIDKNVFWGDIKGVPTWITSDKPRYSYSELSGRGTSDNSNDVWVVKKDAQGNSYVYTKLDVVVERGVTMYGTDGSVNLPSIYDGLPLDNDTIYWEETKDEEGNVIARVLKSRGVGEGGVTPTLLGDLKNVGEWANAIATEDRIMVQKKDSDQWVSLSLKDFGTASFENVKESGEGNAFTSFTLSDDKKTLTFVKGDTFTKKADFDTLNTKVTVFLEGSDTDNIINKWKELEAFLGGMTESDELATILSGKADTATTLSGYGITNAYTKNETDDLLDEKADWGTTLSHYGITNAYTKTQADDILKGKADWGTTLEDYGITDAYTKTGVDELLEDYLPLTGGTITGNLRLRTGSEYTSPYLYFGDSDEVYLKEATDQYLTIHADKGIILDSPLTTIDGIEIKKSADGVLYIDANLVVSGGITMYGTDGTTSSSIWDGAPIASTSVKGIASFDSEFFAVSNGKVTFIGETGGGGASSWDDLEGKPSWIGSTKPSYTFSEIGSKPTTISGYGITDAKISNGVITLGSNTITPLTQTTGDARYLLKDSKDYMKVNGSLTSNVDFDTYYTSGSYNNTTGNGSGNTNAPGSYGLMLVFGDKGGYAAQLHVGASADSVKIRARYSHGGSMAWRGWNEIVVSNYAHTITPSETDKYNLGSSSYQWSNLFAKKTTIDGISIYKSSTGVLRIDGDVVLSGALTMFGTDSVDTSTIMDGVNVDGTTIIKSGNKLMLNPDLELGGGGLDETALASYLSSWAGSSSIKNVGTITSGTWNGSKIANAYLANSAVTISGKSVSLGGSLSQADLRTALGLGSNAYTSTSYLPSANYTAADVLAKLKTVDGADSGLDADLLDGYHVSRFPLLNAVCGSSYDLNNADRAGYYNVSMSINRPSEAYGYGMMETIEVHTGVNDSEKRTLQVYYPHNVTANYKYYGMAVRMRNGASNATNNVWGDWIYFVTKDGNVASATTASKLATERTIWGQSFDGSGDITGHLYLVGAHASSSTGNTSQILFGTPSSHHLALSSNTNALIVNPTSSSTTGQIVLGVNGKSSYFTSSGNFGIGTSTPSSKLHVVGGVTAGALSFGNEYQKSINSAGWYRFATSKTGNNAGGTYLFFIRRSYYNTNNEAYIISCTIDYGKVHWCLLNGHANTRLITQVRCTYTNNGTIYFDFYYNGSAQNYVYVNAVGDCTLQAPTATTSTLTSTSTFGLGDGMIVDGNLLTTGGITMYGSSDKRLKKNIRTFQAGKELMSLGGVYQFEYEDEEISRNAMYKGTHVGLIYQNVKGTILDKMCYEREDGYGALNYLDSSFISLLAGVGVEHETRIQRLERENEELRKEIEQLKKV